jgi:ferritin-like metal-binding protein YciE
MGMLTHTTLNNLNDLFVNQLQDLYDAENRLIDALPKMADAANSPELKTAFRDHLAQTEEHARRLERIFGQMGQEPERETCEAMKGLVREGAEMIDAKGSPAVKDAALIAAAQRVEHYEMAGYGSVRTFAQHLGHPEFAQILQQTLDEEGAADKRLTMLATTEINSFAASHPA